ncbi:hypothetical protein DCAR_0414744 [Daucus carota subsp. sativus]|uniref:23 kDa jasmonate-induced protein-like n=1 Tax=Daucus carota subsp. sativus TaxID=79200 RepID=A0A164ZZU0_DAUCS|nr:PREDICTED: 23 kDa jasmonate-induced protein-like [Daucus carota subsp. sativus]WOG95425.1 hypothetical protein DCAR_0414744 [Daucus carota subsp. sativus]
MANPFGQLVDDRKLDTMSDYVGKAKTQEDRAREAMRLINEHDKNGKARRYVDGLKTEYGNGATTLCMVYNATGETLYYNTSRDWYGFIGRTPYPFEIGNGQWASFLHVKKTSAASGSEAALVFRGKNASGQNRDFCLAWSSPWSGLYKNKAYCDVGSTGSFNRNWNTVYSNLQKRGGYTHSTDDDGVNIKVSTAAGFSPLFVAEIRTPFAPKMK